MGVHSVDRLLASQELLNRRKRLLSSCSRPLFLLLLLLELIKSELPSVLSRASIRPSGVASLSNRESRSAGRTQRR